MPSSIKADALILSPTLRQQLGVPDIPSGNSGNITIDTPNLDLFDRAEVTVSNQGTAAIGNLTINGDRLNLDRNARLTALSSSGKGGSIQLRIEDFLFLDRDTDQSQSRISPKTIVEAQAWQINSAGKIKLIAIAPSHSRFDNHQCQSN